MKRITMVTLVLVTLLITSITPVAVEAQEEWVQVGVFTGKGDKTTAPVDISGAKWRINWTAEEAVDGVGIFGFFVYPEGETVMYVESIMHSDGSASDTTYIYQGKGSFYIKVGAANLSSWTIEVEDCISAVPPPPPSPAPPKPEEEEDEGCFIATAAYGTDTAEEIDVLRKFRDEVLVASRLGAQFVSFYYRISPPIADFISEHEILRTIVREGFVVPIVAILNWTHNLWSD